MSRRPELWIMKVDAFDRRCTDVRDHDICLQSGCRPTRMTAIGRRTAVWRLSNKYVGFVRRQRKIEFWTNDMDHHAAIERPATLSRRSTYSRPMSATRWPAVHALHGSRFVFNTLGERADDLCLAWSAYTLPLRWGRCGRGRPSHQGGPDIQKKLGYFT